MNIVRKVAKSMFLMVSVFVIGMGSFVLGSQTVHATGPGAGDPDTNLLCDIFPFIYDISFTKQLCGTNEGETARSTADTVIGLVKFGVSLIFIGIIILAVYTIIKAAIVYIRSEGDEGKIQESQKAIKAVFVGIGALIVGIIGLVIILAVFDATSATDKDADAVDPITLLDDTTTP